MSEKKRTRQFGIRKLLLWTAVVAFLLGYSQWVSAGHVDWILLGCIATVGAVRAVVGIRGTVALSVALGVAWGIFAAYVTHMSTVPRWRPVVWQEIAGICVFSLPLGCFFGLVLFVMVDLVCRAVDWADNGLRTKTDD